MDYRIEQLRQKIREEPASRQFFQLGELLRKQGELEEAATVLTSGLEHFPRYVAAWLSLGRVELQREAFDDAERAFSKAMELDSANGAAARMLGETALARGDWLKAHKAFKFANALAPQDEEIEKALVRVEAKLAEAGHEPGYDTQDLIEEVAFQYRQTQDASESPEVFAVSEEPEPVPSSPATAAESPKTDVFAVSEDDPFDTDPGATDTTGQDALSDVFAAESEDSREATSEVLQESGAPVEVPTIARDEPFTDAPDSSSPEVEEAESKAIAEEGMPIPTLTLARLAYEQGDLALAEKTLHAVLDREPDSTEAMALLAEVTAGPAPEKGEYATQSRGEDLVVRKIVALQSWLEGIRLAAEQRAL